MAAATATSRAFEIQSSIESTPFPNNVTFMFFNKASKPKTPTKAYQNQAGTWQSAFILVGDLSAADEPAVGLVSRRRGQRPKGRVPYCRPSPSQQNPMSPRRPWLHRPRSLPPAVSCQCYRPQAPASKSETRNQELP